MKNYVQKGDAVDLTAPAGGLASGQGYLFGDLFGVATKAAAAGERLAVSLEGVFSLPKETGTALTEGQKIYWDGTQITATATDNTFVGHVIDAAAADATSVNVRLWN